MQYLAIAKAKVSEVLGSLGSQYRPFCIKESKLKVCSSQQFLTRPENCVYDRSTYGNITESLLRLGIAILCEL